MTEEIKDMELEDEVAFDTAAAEIMGDDTDIEDTITEDEDQTSDESDDLDDEDVGEEDTSEDAIEDDDDSEEQDTTDYRALYDQMVANNATLRADLTDVEAKFKSWKGRVEAEEKKKTEAKKEEPKSDFEITPEMEEVFELYPEMLPQVQNLITQKVSREVSGVEERVAQLIEQQVKPIATRVQESEAQAHNKAIFDAHPDIETHIANGSFKNWVSSLPVYQRVGAQYICDRGTAQEVINLFDEFKHSALGEGVNQQSPTKKPASKGTNAKKLKDALGVASEPTKVSKGSAKNSVLEEDPNKLFRQAAAAIMQEDAGL